MKVPIGSILALHSFKSTISFNYIVNNIHIVECCFLFIFAVEFICRNRYVDSKRKHAQKGFPMNRSDLKEKEKAAAEKSRGFLAEFRKFITRGNVIDMAVGVIIGAAFQAIINSLVNDIIMPVISVLTGGIDFSNWFLSLDGNHYDTLKAAQDAGAATLNYGTFLTAVINFILMALVIFVLVKILNSVSDRVHPKEEAAPTEKTCPYCKSKIPVGATKCPFCTSALPLDTENMQ